MRRKIAEHIFSETLRWDVYCADTMPADVEDQQITAVSALCTIDDHLILCRNHRWRDMTGWHIEPWETLEDALRREAYEEGGVHIDTYSLYWYIQRTSTVPLPRPDGGYYPYPHSYIPRYHCPISMTLAQRYASPPVPSGAEISDVMLCRREDIDALEMLPHVKEIAKMFFDEWW